MSKIDIKQALELEDGTPMRYHAAGANKSLICIADHDRASEPKLMRFDAKGGSLDGNLALRNADDVLERFYPLTAEGKIVFEIGDTRDGLKLANPYYSLKSVRQIHAGPVLRAVIKAGRPVQAEILG